MATTLVIKGASFSTNKIETVTFGEEVPCTAITLTSDSMNFTAEGQEIEIGYTLTPENTTDPVSIVSSDTNVAVIEDGKVKCAGVGSAIVTITCGSQTATISISTTITMARYFKTGKYVQPANSSANYCIEDSANNFGYCGAETAGTDVKNIASSSQPYIPVYMLPNNCARIDIKVPTGWKSMIEYFIGKQPYLPGSGNAYLISGEAVAGAVEGNRTVTIPEGTTAIAIVYRCASGSFDPSALTGYDVTFLASA